MWQSVLFDMNVKSCTKYASVLHAWYVHENFLEKKMKLERQGWRNSSDTAWRNLLSDGLKCYMLNFSLNIHMLPALKICIAWELIILVIIWFQLNWEWLSRNHILRSWKANEWVQRMLHKGAGLLWTSMQYTERGALKMKSEICFQEFSHKTYPKLTAALHQELADYCCKRCFTLKPFGVDEKRQYLECTFLFFFCWLPCPKYLEFLALCHMSRFKQRRRFSVAVNFCLQSGLFSTPGPMLRGT